MKLSFLLSCWLLAPGITFGQINDINAAKEFVGKHKTIFTQPPQGIPSAVSVDAPLLGNGYTGVAISGAPEKQVYYVARNDFWRLKSSLNQSFPAVLGKIEIDIPELNNASYHVEQDLYAAKTYSHFKKGQKGVSLCTYVAATEDVMIFELSNNGESAIEGKVNLTFPSEKELIDNPPFDSLFKDDREQGLERDGLNWISRGFSDKVDIASKAAIAINILKQPSNTFTMGPGKKTWIVAAFSSNFKSDDCVNTVVANVTSTDHEKIDKLEKAHVEWWSDFWKKSWVQIQDQVIEKEYYVSNYTLASCSRDKDFPPSIFGTWITKERPAWNGDYHLNYNHMAPYYGLFSSNHIEQAIPHDAPLLAIMDRGKYYSKQIAGIKNGIILPVGIGPLGIETTRRNSLMEVHRSNWIEQGSVEDEGLFYGQKSNSAYGVVNMSAHFYSTYDLDYAKQVYPYIKGVATFWENYLEFRKGRYMIFEDAIHEGTVGTMNPILSLGLVRMVMKTAIDMSTELSIDEEKHDKWQHILDHLSDFPTQRKQGKKVFRYTEGGTAWWRDNTLGIQHIYPSGQIGLDSDEELIEVSLNTIDVMQRWLDNNGSNSFFPAAVRLGYDPEEILSQLRKYAEHTYPNGFQDGNPHGIENMSTVPNTINEMLLQSHEGIIRLFPVWPRGNAAEFHQLRTYGAFLVSSKMKHGQISHVEIYSERGRICKVLNPWLGKQVVLQRAGIKDELLSGGILEISTFEGELLKIFQAIPN